MINKDIFTRYLTGHIAKETATPKTKNALPVVTISREAGCGAEHIAKKLVVKLNALYPNAKPKWRYINKEVMESAAEKLKLRVDEVERNYNQEGRALVEDLFFSFGKNYYNYNDVKVKKTIMKVVRDFAMEGNIIIVGRAGESLTQGFDRALHTSLKAPLSWRKQNLIERWEIDEQEAEEYIERNDKRREHFRSFYSKGKEVQFDFTIDTSRFTEDEIVEILHDTLKLKKYLK
ncbi:cytidylate kinase-like family protein [Persicobacter psychrovividus]|uniref:Cytidylate kinase n=1 Tax=Persicobacter psychrovividus TaxID=387638 RepID=A0ABM7VGY4_9BACT|nr:hypothetical protein PEPS_24940 [Persicobacter psychrovividus]